MKGNKGLLIPAAFFAMLSIAGYRAAILGVSAQDPNTFGNLMVGIVSSGLLLLFLLLFIRSKSASSKKSKRVTTKLRANKVSPEERRRQENDYKLRQMEEIKAVTTLPIVSSPISVVLKSGETCHYQCSATVLILKNQVIGRTGGYRGASIRVAKGLTLHTGGSSGHSVRGDIPYYYPGIFTITNERFIMTGEKGFDKPISKLTAITPREELDGVVLQFGSTSYIVLMDTPIWVPKILDLLCAKDNL